MLCPRDAASSAGDSVDPAVSEPEQPLEGVEGAVNGLV